MPVAPRPSCRSGLGLAAGLALLATPAMADDAATRRRIDELARTIAQQQKLIEQQQATLQQMGEELGRLQGQVQATRATADAAGKEAASATSRLEETALVTSSNPKLKVRISGQADRAVNVANDGQSTKAYFVDNGNSNSRLRVTATGQPAERLTAGARIEIGIKPNDSQVVSQNDQSVDSADDSFDPRIVEVFMQHADYGTLYLGKGSTAADNSAEVDLSGTDVASYASVTDIAGGLQFRSSSGGHGLTGLTLGDAFNDLDGSRKDRIRYDTPTFAGFSLATSAYSDQRYDTALWWNGEPGKFKVSAAGAVQWINTETVDHRFDGSVSALHQPSGLNLTLSGGMDDVRDGDNAFNIYVKTGWLAKLLPLGPTAMSLDYTRSLHRPIDLAGSTSADGNVFGAALVQTVADYGIDVYGAFHWYTLDPNGSPGVEDIYVGTVGGRVRF